MSSNENHIETIHTLGIIYAKLLDAGAPESVLKVIREKVEEIVPKL